MVSSSCVWLLQGRIPVNEFGTVNLFKPWMLPDDTVHLAESRPGLQKFARSLGIDCVPAMVAWEFHGGFNHPVYVPSLASLPSSHPTNSVR